MTNVFVGNEAVFRMDGHVGNHNILLYAPDSGPTRLIMTDLSKKAQVSVSCGLPGNQILGPCFYDNNIDGQSYLDMLNNVIIPDIWAKPEWVKQITELDGSKMVPLCIV